MKNKTGWIYAIENKVNGKMYIGLTRDIKDRWYRHKRYLRLNEHVNEHLQNSYNKHGRKKFKFKIIEKGIPVEELGQKEKFYINKFDTFKNGYNGTTGGEKNYSMSEESKEKLRQAFTGEKSSTNKITPEEGVEIFNKYHSSKLTYLDLAEEHDLCHFTISNIVTCKHWSTKHLKDKKPKITQSKKQSDLTIAIGKKIVEERKKNNLEYKKIAAKYNTNPSTVGEIIRGEHWTTKHLVESKNKKSKKYHYVDKNLGLKIYKLYHNTEASQNSLADKFNLSQASIWNIVNCKHKSTKHLKE